jgi:hypothetical protein
MTRKVSVFCIWRDSEKTIFNTLKQLENLESIDGFEFSYFFYENDSKDKTVEILSEWMSKRNGSFLSENLNATKFGSTTDPERMKLLCECRNKCKNLAKENSFDYSLLIDSDIEFNNENFLIQIDFLDKSHSAVMATPNVRQKIPDYTFGMSEDSYYDVYAFRDKHGNLGMYFSDCPSYKREDQLSWKLGIPIRCLSSFGGFAIIKTEIFNKVKWHSDIHCDHVNMCFDLCEYGEIYCIPKSVVHVDVSTDKIHIESCKKIAKNQKLTFDKYFL